MKKSELRAHAAAIPVAVLGLAGALGVSGAAAQGTELEPVVVTATRTPVPPDQLAAQVVLIDRAAIEQAQEIGRASCRETV